MKVEYAFFAQAVRMDRENMFNVIGGGLEYVWFKKLPYVYNDLGIMARVSFDAEEIGKSFTFGMEMERPDGTKAPKSPQVTIVASPSSIHTEKADLATLHFRILIFDIKMEGYYKFQITHSDHVLVELPLKCILSEKNPCTR